jgi:RimJ/RimL family protein N-acetyltransferase
MIETERLLIRQFQQGDYLDLFEYLSRPETYIFEPGVPITLDQARELATARATGVDFLAVVLKSNSKMIGHIYFAGVEPADLLTWELGYIFNPIFHRQGYASEAAAAVVAHGFSDLGAHRIMARCNPDNPASWKLLERIGFTREGHFHKSGFFRRDAKGNPIWHDAYEYSMIEKPRGLEMKRMCV